MRALLPCAQARLYTRAARASEEELTGQTFPDKATLKREENRRWDVTKNHWNLPIYQVDTTKPR